MFRRTVREFAEREIAPVAAHFDETEEFPAENVRKMAALGLMGLTVPDEYGGAGAGAMEYALAMEEIARADAAHSTVLTVNISLVMRAARQVRHRRADGRRYLPPLCDGRMIGAYCLSEPSSGSDAADMEHPRGPRRRRVGHQRHQELHHQRRRGRAVRRVRLDRPSEARPRRDRLPGRSRSPRVSRPGAKEAKLGIRASSTTQIYFDDCRVPAEQRARRGRRRLPPCDDARSTVVGSASPPRRVGIAQAALDAAVGYAKQRQAFGKPIADFQGLQWMLADMRTRIDAARLLTCQAAALKDADQPFGEAAAMAKLFASETAMWVATKALQIYGGYGYMRESPSSATSATPRSPRSTKAPPRSSAWSSRASYCATSGGRGSPDG